MEIDSRAFCYSISKGLARESWRIRNGARAEMKVFAGINWE